MSSLTTGNSEWHERQLENSTSCESFNDTCLETMSIEAEKMYFDH